MTGLVPRHRLGSVAVVVAATCAVLGFAVSSFAVPDRATAQCEGSDCLPGGGYTYEDTWNCGPIYAQQACYQPGNCLSSICGDNHSFGFGSADYDGGGRIAVGISAPCVSGCSGTFDAVGINLARACARSNCNDVAPLRKMFVAQGDNNRHTVKGRGKA